MRKDYLFFGVMGTCGLIRVFLGVGGSCFRGEELMRLMVGECVVVIYCLQLNDHDPSRFNKPAFTRY
jgi:hypothetical protein